MLSNIWKGLSFYCMNGHERPVQMTFKEGSSLFYACPKYMPADSQHPDGHECYEAACANRLSFSDAEKIVSMLSDAVQDSLCRDDLCDFTGYRFRLGAPEVSKMVLNIIKNESSAYLSEKKAKEIVRIDIDLSALGSIRRSSDIIREKLLVDEDEETAEETDTVQSDDPAEEKFEDCSASLLNAEELAFLAALINNGDWKKAASDSGSMPSLLTDSINDKLFDSFGDTVIDYSSDQPEVISDYEDELRQLFNI